MINIINMKRGNWLDSAEALSRLGVRRQSLYASVSRGRIRARPDPQDPRRSLYHAGDVERLAWRQGGRPRDERLAAQAIDWGNPVLSSAISTVAQGRLWYRGQDAVQLAERASLEEVAALLWQGDPIAPLGALTAADDARAGGETPMQAAYRVLAARAGSDAPLYGRSVEALRTEAVGLVAALCAAMVCAAERSSIDRSRGMRAIRRGRPRTAHTAARTDSLPLHEHLARAWRRPAAADVIRRALGLLADHELNASTFATRVAASTGASLSASVLAGFATLSGPIHGGAAAALQGFIESARRMGIEPAILASLAQGRPIAAFGHPLYPQGDIRAIALLQTFPPPPLFEQLRQAAYRLIGESPNIDFALAALTASADLPADAPFVLFALARCIGWIAHALEQHQSGSLIRPRARYTGPALALMTPSAPYRHR